MSVKLAILKSGEDIVADIKEMLVGEGDDAKVVGLLGLNVRVFVWEG